MTGTGDVRLFGGAAFVLGYGRTRTTDDADLLLDEDECSALIDHAGFSEAIEATNRDLEPRGLYLTHIFGPEQQILTPRWKDACRRVPLEGLSRLRVFCLGPVDLALSKLGRADDEDLADISFLLQTRQLDPEALREAIDRARVPPEYAELFAAAKPKVLALLARAG
ncbi:MAG: DUF6036 family nucleotidyltransferase [Myxococcaceae bacterium]